MGKKGQWIVPTGQEEPGSVGTPGLWVTGEWGRRQCRGLYISLLFRSIIFFSFHRVTVPGKGNEIFHTNPTLGPELNKKIVKVLCKHESTLLN